MNLTPKSPVRVMYTKVPFAIDFRVYMFNLTNREEVSKGNRFIIYRLTLKCENHH